MTKQLKEQTEQMFWCSGSGEVELELSQWYLDNQPTQGQCLPSVLEALESDEVPSVAKQLEKYSSELIVAMACEYGCNAYGNEGKPTVDEAKQFITWIAIGDMKEEQFMKGNSDDNI